MSVFETNNGHIILNYVQWIEPIRRTSNGYAFDIHLLNEVCNLAFENEGEAENTLDQLIRALTEIAA